jgi:hypothetical protein
MAGPNLMSVCTNSGRPLDKHHRAGTEYPYGILSIALQLIHGATEGTPGGPGPVFLTGDLFSLADNNARGLGRLFLCPGVGD